jgi:N-acetylmuramoyl-L-alanine amidase
MSSTLRSLAVASCTAIFMAGFATSAGASSANSPAFTLQPTFGLQGSKITLSGADFNGETAVKINGVTAADFHGGSSSVTAVIPAGATSGPVTVTGAKTLSGPSFTVQQKATGTSSLSTDQLTFTHHVIVTGALTVKSTGDPIAGQLASLQHRVEGSKVWHHAKGVANEKTGSHGLVRWSVKPATNGFFRVHFFTSPTFRGVTSGGHWVAVLPRLHLSAMHTVPVLSSSILTGTVRPRLSGVVYLQRYVNGAWHRVATSTVEDGRYSFTISPTTLGTRSYRVVRKFDGTHSANTSGVLLVHVVNRELVIGDSGPDVTTLQKRLRKLHYDTGSVNGEYGWDTLHAVTAFEKVQGISPNGEVSTKVWKALNHPKRIHLRYPGAGKYEVEVNIGKQVLLMGKNGKVVHILDTSTAGGYLYTNSEGGTSRAITPTGHFSIQYKLTGTRVSKLGTLYYPSYFTNTGYAIHGEGNGNDGGNVPPYPNSHGCVRITDDAVLRYFSTPWLAVGSSVWIYH